MSTVFLVLAVVTAIGCTRNDGVQPSGPTISPAEVEAAFTDRAQKVAALWQKAVEPRTSGFIPLDELTIWSKSIDTEAEKQAATRGWFEPETALPDVEGRGVVRFPDGEKLDVPLVGAASGLKLLVRIPPRCYGCDGLIVTGAKLTTTKLMTSRGTAIVPAWAYTIRGLAEPMMRVAVASQAIVKPPSMTDRSIAGRFLVSPADQLSAVSGDRIDYSIVIGSCDTGERALVWESDRLIVLGGTVAPPQGGNCNAMGLTRTVSATLSGPVNNRVIVDVDSGSALRINRPPVR